MRFLFLVLHLVCGITNHPNGTGGEAPEMYQYVMVNADASNSYTGFDPHAVHGIVTENNGYIAAGFSVVKETNGKYMGFVVRVDLCSDITQYESLTGVNLNKPGTNCKNSFTWSFKDSTPSLHGKFAWVTESPDGSYVIAVGVKEINKFKHQRYIVKLNAATGEQIWSIKMSVDDAAIGKRSGYESVAFTQDGGFVVAGYANYKNTEFPFFKSSGQVDSGNPLLEKFSASVANADRMDSAPTTEWTYICNGAAKCNMNEASAKAVRIYFDNGREIVATVPGVKSSILMVDAATGAEIDYKQLSDADGTASDIEVVQNKNGKVQGFVTVGLEHTKIHQDGTDGCPAKGCTKINGRFTKYSADLSEKVWETKFGNFPGGQYQYEGLSTAPEALVYTECFGLTKVFDTSKKHVGYIGACGQGIEGCNAPMTQSIINDCKKDPRRDWRSTTVRIDLEGNLVWYRMDNFKEEGSNKVASSAAEYVMTGPDGRVVSLTDETMGFGFVTYQCENNVNCPGSVTTIKPETTTGTTTASSQATTTTASTTASTTPEADVCTDVAIIAPAGGSYGKVKANTKYPLGGISARSVQIRYNFVKQIWNKEYLGFLTFTKNMCGNDFITAVSEGRVTFDVLDKAEMYDSVKQFVHKTKTAVTIQFYHMKEGSTATDYGSAKKDTLYLMLSGVDGVTFGNKNPTNCYEKAKVDIVKAASSVGDGQTDLSKCVAVKY